MTVYQLSNEELNLNQELRMNATPQIQARDVGTHSDSPDSFRSKFFEFHKKIFYWFFGIDPYPNMPTLENPVKLYLGLFSGDKITDEISARGYARQEIQWEEYDRGFRSTNQINFTAAGEAWGKIRYAAVFDKPTGGNVLFYSAISERDIQLGDVIEIVRGYIYAELKFEIGSYFYGDGFSKYYLFGLRYKDDNNVIKNIKNPPVIVPKYSFTDKIDENIDITEISSSINFKKEANGYISNKNSFGFVVNRKNGDLYCFYFYPKFNEFDIFKSNANTNGMCSYTYILSAYIQSRILEVGDRVEINQGNLSFYF